MPHTKSAKKRLRQSLKRRDHNRDIKKDLKVQFKQFQRALETGTVEELRKEYNTCAMKLDKAAARHVIHKNKASRKKAQLARHVNTKATAAPKA